MRRVPDLAGTGESYQQFLRLLFTCIDVERGLMACSSFSRRHNSLKNLSMVCTLTTDLRKHWASGVGPVNSAK